MPKLFVIDLMPFLYRGHFVFLKSPRITSAGLNTSALLGFVNSVSAILADHSPSHVVLAMDSQGPTFRHKAYPPYKAQREKMPEDLAVSIPWAFEVAEALGIPVVRREGFEADDVMGSIAVKAAAAGFDVYCATPDKDAAQLVTDKIKLFRPSHGKEGAEVYDIEAVKSHWKLSSPAQMIDYLALAGDASDNVPGIRGVGEKTAGQLLADYGTVENIVAHASELKGKLAEKIAAGAEDAKMSKFLVTILTDVPLADFDLESCRVSAPDPEKLRAVCAKFELFSLSRKFGLDAMAASEVTHPLADIGTVPHEYSLVRTRQEAESLARILKSAPRFAFDTETTGMNSRTAKLVGMSFATEKGRAWYVDVPHASANGDLFDLAAARDFDAEAKAFISVFASAFADPAKTLVAQNAKYDVAVLSRYGISFGSTVHDTMLEHYVVDAASRHGMDALAREFLSYDPIPIEKLIGERARGKEQKNMADLKPEEICDYAAEDADVTLQLEDVLRPRAVEAGVGRALEESEEPLVPILVEMEREGVRLDVQALREYGIRLDREIQGLLNSIHVYSGPGLNVDSPKQLAEFLFEKLNLDAAGAKKTSSGQYSTDEKTLQKLVDYHPVILDILSYRTCAKLKSTYVDKLPLCIDPADGRVHTTFAQALTETGRLSSSEPNLQNIPIRTERGRPIRAAIIPRDGNVLVAADYSQIELRIMAAMSGDEAMLKAFRDGEDVHRATAARVYGVPLADVTPEQRSHCKMVNFGIIYGISSFGLSQRLKVTRREAAELIDSYFKLYPSVREYMDRAVSAARKTGYAVTMLGRRRTIRDISSRNATARQSAERDAMNTPIQGSAADLIKLAMVRVDRALKSEGLKAKMILQIHDELLFDVPADEVARVKELAKREMEGAWDFGVPLEVSVGAGKNWLEAH